RRHLLPRGRASGSGCPVRRPTRPARLMSSPSPETGVRLCPKCGQQWPQSSGTASAAACPACMLDFAFGATDALVSAAPATPRHIGSFTILDTLGRGGMGTVYRARHEGLDRTVALKVLDPACAGRPGFPERFRREGQMLAALNHPQIVGVFDF